MKTVITAIISIILILAFFWLSKPSEADIQACVASTGWSKAKCLTELTR